MSITFMIDNGHEYIRANHPEMIDVEQYDCQCVDFSEDGKPFPHCQNCNGKGEVTFDIFPFELNITNGNAYTLLASLGLEVDCCGEIDPRALLKAINRTPVALLLKGVTKGTGEKGCQWIDLGLNEERADYYLTSLKEIAEEAEKREEKVYWC